MPERVQLICPACEALVPLTLVWAGGGACPRCFTELCEELHAVADLRGPRVGHQVAPSTAGSNDLAAGSVGPVATDTVHDLADAITTAGFGFVLLGGDGRVRSANTPVCGLLGRAASELIGGTFRELVHPDDRGWSQRELALLFAGEVQRVRQHVRLLGADGMELWCELHARTAGPVVNRSAQPVVMLVDAGDHVLRERELQRLADTDSLTGLYNRRRFAVEVERHRALAERYDARGALLLLDIDDLKSVNDTHGHHAGDQVIVATADLLRRQLRSTDIIARIGGDEFAVLLPHVDEAGQAAATADSLLQAARATEAVGSHARLEFSIGIAIVTGADHDQSSILQRADAAMYEIKHAGGGGYAIDA